VADAGRAAGLDLMQVAKQVESRPASTIVQFRMGQYTEECTLANVRIAQDSQTQVNELRTEGHWTGHVNRRT